MSIWKYAAEEGDEAIGGKERREEVILATAALREMMGADMEVEMPWASVVLPERGAPRMEMRGTMRGQVPMGRGGMVEWLGME